MRFIKEVIGGTLVVSNRRKAELLTELQQKGYKMFFAKPLKAKDVTEGDEGEQEVRE